MRVALVHRDLHQITRGGICTLYLALAEHLTRAGHEVILVTQATEHPVVRDQITVVTLPRTDDLAAHRTAVAATIARLAPDVAECSTWEAELLTYAQQPSHVPVLVRGDLSAATMGAHALAADEAHLCRLADAVVAVSAFAADDLSTAYGLPRPTVIPHGVDRTRFTPTGPTRPATGWQIHLDRTGTVTTRQPLADVVRHDPAWASYFTPSQDLLRLVWVGKATQMKGFDRLTRIAAALPDHARLLIVLGHGHVHYPIDLPADVLLCQDLHTSDVPAVYRAAEYLLSTSRWEGYGLAIAEALACGTPALLPTDLAVTSELITPGVSGLLWTDETDLHQILNQRPHLTGHLPAHCTWDATTTATCAIYQAMTLPQAAR
ncbi:MAG: glycosyltransferase family 4 protein [Actinomycetota bacterium]|nr:glycosyltransferase family 4 protein [Actinomycetota bacterium]